MSQSNEITTALEYVIYQEARGKFAANGIDVTQAKTIMKAVYSRFLEDYVEFNTLSRLQTNKPEEQTKTGTVDELMEDFRKTGLSGGE